jgi:hypothetical protein
MKPSAKVDDRQRKGGWGATKVPNIPGTNRRFRSCEQIGHAAMMRRNIYRAALSWSRRKTA